MAEVFACATNADVLRVSRPGTRWLSTGWNGGFSTADAAYNVTVPEGFGRTDLGAYARERRAEAGFEGEGPTLFTGVAQRHARGARAGPVEAVATAGLSNPAALPMAPGGDHSGDGDPSRRSAGSGPSAGTVNVVVGTDRALAGGTLASLVATVAEAKAATLLAEAGVPGTTSDAVVVGCDPAGPDAPFAGSATELGDAARACVREAVRASLASRYEGEAPPASVEEARHGTRTDRRADVFVPG